MIGVRVPPANTPMPAHMVPSANSSLASTPARSLASTTAAPAPSAKMVTVFLSWTSRNFDIAYAPTTRTR